MNITSQKKIGAPPGNQNARKAQPASKVIQVRVTPQQKQTIKLAAGEMPVSKWILSRLIKKRIEK